MIFPLWQRLWSYFFEVLLETTSSAFNPSLQVFLNRGRAQLCTPNAIYSYGDLYDNFTKTFEQIDLSKLSGKRVLLLGLGLGSIPFMLERRFKLFFDYTAVEIDAEVVRLAEKYVLCGLESRVTTICGDAFAFINQQNEQFDLICMDVFSDDMVPNDANSSVFLQHLANALAPDGLLLFNRLSFHPEERAETIHYFRDHFLPHFPNGTYIDTESNYVLVSNKLALRSKP